MLRPTDLVRCLEARPDVELWEITRKDRKDHDEMPGRVLAWTHGTTSATPG